MKLLELARKVPPPETLPKWIKPLSPEVRADLEEMCQSYLSGSLPAHVNPAEIVRNVLGPFGIKVSVTTFRSYLRSLANGNEQGQQTHGQGRVTGKRQDRRATAKN